MILVEGKISEFTSLDLSLISLVAYTIRPRYEFDDV
jgi:hypothetical protein